MGEKMKILVIGSGGREHAIAWKLSLSPRAERIYAAPGNAGIAEVATCLRADLEDVDGLAELARQMGADMTVVGPEAPLVAGIADAFAAKGLSLVGPSRLAARLEGSKVFAKQFMRRHSIPTARFAICESPEEARAALEREFEFPAVVKADGLAAGKGVRIVTDRREFEDAINAIMVERAFGAAGSRIVLEECLFGQEASLMLFTDGRDYKLIAPARDYKRAYDGDLGPNTGGMGSFSTPGLIPDDLIELIRRRIVEPTLEGMAAEGYPFSGALYLGLMLTESGPMVLEYNARLGDPEAQAVLVRLESDLVEICEAIVSREVGRFDLAWSDDSAVCVVLASGGYPGQFEKGKLIEGISQAQSLEGVVIFHAGTARDERGNLITAGGRVLGVTARAPSLEAARARAYEAASKISFDRMHYRKDIAARS